MNIRTFFVGRTIGFLVVVALVGGFFLFNAYIYNEKQAPTAQDYKNATYVVNGMNIELKNGVSDTEAAPGSASRIVTRFFGNELFKDLNEDGKDDVVFLVTQQTGGSGTFYYVVAALATERGYLGGEGVLLGDRIAPQSTQSGPGKSVVITYADRAPGESFDTQPSVGKSIRLILDPNTRQFGEVAQNFEGEADPARMTLTMKTWVWISALYNDERVVTPKQPKAFSVTFKEDGTFSATTDCNNMMGTYTANNGIISFGPIASTKMYCEGSQEATFGELLRDTSGYHFTSKGELVFDLKFDSGNVIFR